MPDVTDPVITPPDAKARRVRAPKPPDVVYLAWDPLLGWELVRDPIACQCAMHKFSHTLSIPARRAAK